MTGAGDDGRSRRAAPGAVRDPRISWRILLEARLTSPLPAEVLARRWAQLARAQGWPASVPLQAATAGQDAVLAAPEAIALALDAATAERVWIAAHHDTSDGLGLLRCLDALLEGGVRSDARGVAGRSLARGSSLRRLAEVALHPPARLRPPGPSGAGTATAAGEVVVHATADGVHRTADLVHAVARVGASRAHGRQVAVAIGAGRPDAGAPIADASALLRLTGVDRLDRDGVAAALRTAGLQPEPTAGGPAGVLTALALRLLGARLGSTFLVSHLGVVEAPGVADLRFAPVTGSGGLALGAVVLRGRTLLTLRAPGRSEARGPAWEAAALEEVLAAIVTALGTGSAAT